MHKQLEVEVTSTGRAARAAHWALTRHALATFGLYVAGFVAFVLRLRKGCYLYQFRQVRGWEGGGGAWDGGFAAFFGARDHAPNPPRSLSASPSTRGPTSPCSSSLCPPRFS